MTRVYRIPMTIWMALVGLAFAGRGECLTLAQSGYAADIFKSLPAVQYGDIEVDQAGNVFIPTANASGILEVTPVKNVTTWSTARAYDISLTATGSAYGAGGGPCGCLLLLNADGSSSTFHQDGLSWDSVALLTNDSLYATAGGGPGEGLYRIDRVTGVATPIIVGGPGVGGVGSYYALAGGADGKLYVLGNLDNTSGGYRLLRLDGTQLTPVAVLPHGGFELAAGKGSEFYVTTNYTSGTGHSLGELWTCDSGMGTCSVLANTSPIPGLSEPSFDAVGFDKTTSTIYVAEAWKIWAIAKDPTPALSQSWGWLKAIYRK